MTDKQKIRAEIESSMKACEEAFNICPSTAFGSRIDSYKALLSFIDSLPEEPASEGLEEEFERFLDEIEGVPRMWHSEEQMIWGMDIARHFAEWQRQKDQEIDKLTESPDLDEASWKYSDRDGITYGQRYAMQIDFKAGAEWQREQLMKELWHKGTDNPGNKHPYPVINPDTQEMAFAYYYYGWQFDRDYNPGRNMLWLDIEKIIPNLTEGGEE